MDKPGKHKVYEFDEFRLDALHLMLYRKNEELSVPPKAVETLLALVERRGEIVGKDELMNIIWANSFVEESNLSLYLHILRKTLGKREDGKSFIETLRRRGYRFNGEVNVREATNGFAKSKETKAEVVENKIDPEIHEPQKPEPARPNFERHGNVLALADWKERTSHPAEPVAEPREAASDLAGGPMKGPRAFAIAASTFVVIVSVAMFFTWTRYSSNSEVVASKAELSVTILASGEPMSGATISRDGRYFVYATKDGERSHLWLQQPGQASRIEITEPVPGSVYTTFTPDGANLYFVVVEGASSTLYRVPSLGGPRVKVLSNIASPVSFSPDGREMTFTRSSGEKYQRHLMIASNDGKDERILRTVDMAEDVVDWSPDGKLIAHTEMSRSDGLRSIVGADPQSGKTKPLSPEQWDNCYRMVWTIDGKGLVFVGTKAKGSLSTRRDQIYYLSVADGQSRRITTDGSRYLGESLGVTANDEILAAPFNRMSQIWAINANGDSRTVVQITKGFADGRGGIAPLADGQVAYLTRNGEGFSIWKMNADGSDRKQLTAEPPAIEELRAAPDGSFFVFSAKRDDQTHLYRVNSDGSNLKQLTFSDGYEVDSSVSPDGKLIAYHSQSSAGEAADDSLKLIASEGGQPVDLSDIDCHSPHFSPDGRYLSCVSSDWNTISVLSAADGSVVKVFKPVEGRVLNTGVRWTPDGKALVYITFQQNAGNIFAQPVDGSAARKLTDFTSGEIYNLAYSHDGSQLYLARGYAVRNTVLIRNFR